jgi:AGZA family xanthine/uracil permease-like MFS transporter
MAETAMSNGRQLVARNLDKFFSIKERGSSISTEVFAGITTYLSLSFVFILNPAILGAARPDAHHFGMSPEAILFATVVTSSAATFLMGLVAKLPLAVGPGIEVSAFFTFVLVKHMGLSWEEALAAVIVSGLLNIVLTAFTIRDKIVQAIPQGLKASLLLAIGAFVILVGLKLGNVVDVGETTEFSLAQPDFWTVEHLERGPLILIVGLVTAAIFNIRRLRLPWGTLVGIVAAAIACHIFGVTLSSHHGAAGVSTIGKASFAAWQSVPFWSGVVVMFVVDFVGGISKIYALLDGTGIPRPNDKIPVPGLQPALYVDGIATVAGGLLGTSSLIAFVESRIGIQAGGRTGLMAVVCGICMLAGGLFSNVLALIPPEAASGVLIYVGLLIVEVNWKLFRAEGIGTLDKWVMGVMIVAVLCTFQFDIAMLIGFGYYFVSSIIRRVPLEKVFWLGLVGLLLLLTVAPHVTGLLQSL